MLSIHATGRHEDEISSDRKHRSPTVYKSPLEFITSSAFQLHRILPTQVSSALHFTVFSHRVERMKFTISFVMAALALGTAALNDCIDGHYYCGYTLRTRVGTFLSIPFSFPWLTFTSRSQLCRYNRPDFGRVSWNYHD